MKVIISGSRNVTNYHLVRDAIKESGFDITEVVSGGSKGIDKLGEEWADEHDIDVTIFVADFKKWGKAAGPKRNRQMVGYAGALIAVWDGESVGTKNLIEEATKRGLKVYTKLTKAFHSPNPKDVGRK